MRLKPNHISVLSLLFAVLGAVTLVLSTEAAPSARTALLLVTAAAIPLRLLCNMLDGMLAVEKGLHSPTGDLYNEIPDRLADVVLIAGAGYATGTVLLTSTGHNLGVLIGWIAATLAAGTAYVRTLGAVQGVGNFFTGPTAKPARMWILALAAIAAIFEPETSRGTVMLVAVVLIAAGSILTIVNRLRRIVRALHQTDRHDS